jgi:uncharacterized protein involved in exopolysaccharide biosynthesis
MSEEEKPPQYPPLLSDRPDQRAYAVFDVQHQEVDSYAHLRAYGKILSKRRWTILTVVFAVTTLVAIFSYKEKPVYRAAAEVEVDSEMPDLQSVDNLYQTVPTDPTFLETQVDVLNSSNLAWQTIQQLKLDRNPAFNPPASGSQAGADETATTQRGRLIAEFENSLQVDLVTGSRMIKVSFESTDPRLAA